MTWSGLPRRGLRSGKRAHVEDSTEAATVPVPTAERTA